MTDNRFEQLKTKYESVLNEISAVHGQLENVNMQENKLFIRAKVTSQDIKNQIWNQIKLVDPQYSDLIADIQAPAMAAASAAAGSSHAAARTYTVQAGDNLSKISKEFYGTPNQYMKIVEANKDKISDPDKIKPGMQLVIP